MSRLEQIIREHYPEITGIHRAADLFPMIEGEEFAALCEDVAERGLRVPLWVTADGLLVDGRNRLLACYETGTDIRTEVVGGDLIAAVVSANVRRRQLSAGQLAMISAHVRAMYAEEAKERQREATRRGNQTRHDQSPVRTNLCELAEDAGRARDKVAKMFGIGLNYADSAVSVEKHAPHLVEKVKSGEMKLYVAAKEAAAAKKAAKAAAEPAPKKIDAAQTVRVITINGECKDIPKPAKTQFNRTTDSVDWARWTWNPVTGCLHGCNFCYARAITHNKQMADNYPFAFEPTLYEYRLDAPANTPLPKSDDPVERRVFVGSMADLFGKWVPDEWIEKVFSACMRAPEWEYLFLTKWPKRYSMLAELPHAWFGASVIQQSDVARIEANMRGFETSGVKWISLEPMLEPIHFNDLSWCDLVVIGSQTGTSQPDGWVPAKKAHFEWVADVVTQCRQAGVPYYLKPNLITDPGMEMPRMQPRRKMKLANAETA